ncbi:TIGR01457 family HAD-type hydrolase [Aneurinibacillus terranovensis]|uniref:TIGR01457 family HAD-type hydrolase n=1 Tax=Aneurinibacillus terranovensis TaxID=278991 RepID=UPI00042971C1|nr:TIGR01457 family HAD-type hydrolase [Aneurinibacillus terranovensis]
MAEKSYKGYLLDLDGTVYKGKTAIVEAVQFIRKLKERSLPYLYVTNNSSLTPAQLKERLENIGIEAKEGDFFTSSMAAAAVMKNMDKHKNHTQASSEIRVLAIGETGLHTALATAGFQIVNQPPASYVVVGIDRSFTYEKMKHATLAINQGAAFISTNRDRAVPTEEGLVPGNGAITASIACATGKEPMYVGKPEAAIVNLALERLHLQTKEVLLIGDNLETDIAAGAKSGMDTLLVYTGFSRKEDVEKSAVKPTYTAEHLLQWNI